MSSTWSFCILVVLFMAIASGCQTWRPPLGEVTTQPAEATQSLDDYLRAMRTGHSTYLRCSSPCDHDSEMTEYVRVQNSRRLTEGRLLDSDFQQIEHYLRPSRSATSRPSGEEVLKTPQLKGAGFVYFKLEEPPEAIPSSLTRGEPDIAVTEITYYDYLGRPAARGTLTRTAELEGFETISCPAGTFQDCLRVRVDLELKFPWVLHMTWTSYLWISRQVGEVRRVHHLTGWFLIFWFSSGHEYELQEVAPLGAPEEGAKNLTPRWSCGAILFEQIAPRPVIGGMIVDFESEKERVP